MPSLKTYRLDYHFYQSVMPAKFKKDTIISTPNLNYQFEYDIWRMIR